MGLSRTAEESFDIVVFEVIRLALMSKLGREKLRGAVGVVYDEEICSDDCRIWTDGHLGDAKALPTCRPDEGPL
ncbi:hypothetical protein TTRE_0000170801 [Trichuris trichiura]|uniref:Uncharacterized protein n=1 Tax=Trichuris trichiura TaxID=36087 RepID=A0A077Z145_TRITR|nr:hypothetical protein TTRE_0000170801 [Trichuris trichiura]